MTVIIFLIVLAVLIFVHELGHFLFARMCGIRVDAFKIGFGPRMVYWRPKKSDGSKGETEYGINWIPFGGFVKIHGENPDEENTYGPDASRSFINKSRWKQVVVLVAGVLFNVIFAWILYVGLFTHGVTATTDGFEKYSADFSNSRIMVTDVLLDSPAAKAGLSAGDVVEQVGNNNGDINAVQNAINASAGKPISFEYLRDGQTETALITPITGLVPDKYAIGIAMDNVVDMRLPFFTAIYEGAHYTWIMLDQTAVGLYSFIANIFQGTANFSDISGPVGIAGIVGSAAKMGFTYLLMVTALISINLAIVNLIPFPALDGGRILFVAIEGIIRRRISAKFTNIVNTVGFVLLMVLMVIITYRDIAKLVMK